MINFKALGLATLIGFGGMAVLDTKPVQANPIINNHRAEQYRAQTVQGYELNAPINGGTTTLTQKCEAMKYFQNRMDFGGVARMAFQVGFEHPIGALSVDQACQKVGINTFL